MSLQTYSREPDGENDSADIWPLILIVLAFFFFHKAKKTDSDDVVANNQKRASGLQEWRGKKSVRSPAESSKVSKSRFQPEQ